VRKEGHGRGGWGEEGETDRPRNNRRRNDQAQQEAPVPAADKPADEEVTIEVAEETPVVEAVPETPAEPEEPEDVTVSYEDYLAQKELLEGDVLQARVIQNDDKFSGIALVKDDSCDIQIELGSGSSKSKKGKKANTKKSINLDEFVASQAPTNNRGKGRGKGRGRGKGGGYRPPSLNDQHFPKLG